MGIFTQISNKFNYIISSFLNDPDADAYAKQEAAQRQQDAEARERLNTENAEAQANAENGAQAAQEAENLRERSKFNFVRTIGKIAAGVFSTFSSLILFVMIYCVLKKLNMKSIISKFIHIIVFVINTIQFLDRQMLEYTKRLRKILKLNMTLTLTL